MPEDVEFPYFIYKLKSSVAPTSSTLTSLFMLENPQTKGQQKGKIQQTEKLD